MSRYASPEQWMCENDYNGDPAETEATMIQRAHVPNEALDEACTQLLEAAKRIQRLTGAHVNVDLHKLSEDHFNHAPFFGSDWDRDTGDPEYGHVKGQKEAYLARCLYRGEGVLFQFFMNVAPRRVAARV